MMALNPSHLGSYTQPSPSGIARASFASIGSSGGSSGSVTASLAQDVEGLECEPHLEPILRGRQIPLQQLLRLSHPVAKSVAMDPDRLGPRLPPAPGLDEGAHRHDQLGGSLQ